jgi:hypothetical protein
MWNYHSIRRSFCRGKALPRKPINFQIILIWQCFAQTSQRRDKLSMKAQRVEHLHFKMIVGSIKIVAQMLNPYKFFYRALRARIIHDTNDK